MKKTICTVAALLVLAFCLTSCEMPDIISGLIQTDAESTEPSGLWTVSYYDGDTLLKTVENVAYDKINDYKPDDKLIGTRNYTFFDWDLSVDSGARKVEAKARYTTALEKRGTSLLYSEVVGASGFSCSEKNGILVVTVSYTDSDPFDKAEYEKLFTGEYDADNCLRSVNSYYKTNSYGKDLLEYEFVYIDSEWSSAQAWHYVNDEDASGAFVGNDYFYDMFDELRKTRSFSNMDKNGDGFVDAVMFVFRDQETDGCNIYGGAAGDRSAFVEADRENPQLGKYIKIPYFFVGKELTPGDYGSYNTRMLIHEVGHLFEISDYYDFYSEVEKMLDCLGHFDMHSGNVGDLNAYSKFVTGWLHPYVVEDDVETVTLTLRPSMLYDEAVLIPTSKGWNGTAFDEYILIDVMAPVGATGYDWPAIKLEDNRPQGSSNPDGGVRIYHVDARLMEYKDGKYTKVTEVSKEAFAGRTIWPMFYNTNGIEPIFEDESVYHHLVEIVPSGNSSKYRIATPTNWSIYSFFTSADLFEPGDVFSMAACPNSFADAPLMNNKGTFDYEVRVDSYDTATHEATITITKIAK